MKKLKIEKIIKYTIILLTVANIFNDLENSEKILKTIKNGLKRIFKIITREKATEIIIDKDNENNKKKSKNYLKTH